MKDAIAQRKKLRLKIREPVFHRQDMPTLRSQKNYTWGRITFIFERMYKKVVANQSSYLLDRTGLHAKNAMINVMLLL